MHLRHEAARHDTTTQDGAGIRLSFAQQRLWYLSQVEPDRPIYNVPTATRLSGPVDVDALRRSILAVVNRHDALRTRFVVADGVPVQRVDARPAAEVPLVDLCGLEPERREPELQALLSREAGHVFDLGRGPLWRAKILRLATDEHVLFFMPHHTVFDGRSFAILWREIAAFYRHYTERAHETPARLPMQYAEYAAWQRERLRAEKLDRQLSFWRNALRGELPVLDLPADHPRPPVQDHRGDAVTRTVSSPTATEIAAFARAHHASVFMVVLGAYQLFLHRYSSQDDIIVGTAITDRPHREHERMIGMFTQTLALRTSIQPQETFGAFLERVRQTCMDAFAHRDLPFERLVEDLKPRRDPSRTPIFQAFLAFDDLSEHAWALPNIACTPLSIPTGASRTDVSLFARQWPDTLELMLEYSTDLFDRGTAEQMLSSVEQLLRAAIAEPDRPMAELSILSESERSNLTRNVEPDRSVEVLLHELVGATAARHPDAVAVIAGEEALTYRALWQRSAQLAAQLRARGVGPGSLVGLCTDRSAALLVGILGVVRSGAAYVPLDPAFPPDRIAFMLDDARVSTLVTLRSLIPRLPEVDSEPLCLDALPAAPPAETPPAQTGVRPTDPAYVIYTSGSTGRPKGVVIPHRAVVNFLRSMRDAPGLDARDVLLAVTTLSFDIAVLELLLPLVVGGRVVLAPTEVAADGGRLSELIRNSGATVMQATPATWQLLLEAGWQGAPHLKVLCGGEALPRELAAALHARAGALWNMYGPTETTVWSTCHRIEDPADPILIGGPIRNTGLYVLDAMRQPVPVGVWGELFIGGYGVARGYHQRAALTTERFVPDPYSPSRPAAMLYRTGDIVRWRRNGCLEYRGRSDHQVKLRGFRIELGEVEAVLSAHPEVRQAVAIVREDVPKDRRLVAYVIAETGCSPAPEMLRAYLREKLPAYMVPQRFVTVTAFPLTPNAKVDRRALPALGTTAPATDDDHVPPRTETERMIAEVWREQLRVDRIGVHSNFFELGGHSLLAMTTIHRIEQETGRRFTPADILTRTLGELAESLPEAAPALAPLRRRARSGPLRLSCGQEQLWFIDQLDPGTPAYSISEAFRLRGALNTGALARSIAKVQQRHEALRTTFDLVDGMPTARIAPSGSTMSVIDLESVPAEERASVARRQAEEESRRRFDLRAGPLFRASLLRLGPDDHLLVLNVHHIIYDGISAGIVLHELGELYAAERAGRAPSLSKPAIQYTDFVEWQRDQLAGARMAAERAHWKQVLAGAPLALELPSDRPRPSRQTFRGDRVPVELSRALSADLRARCNEARVTPYVGLLAAFQTLLWRLTGRGDFLVGSPHAGRHAAETRDAVGLFINTVVMRADLSGDPSYRELLERTGSRVSAALAHSTLPFGRLVQELSFERDASRNPVFQVMFALQPVRRTIALPELETTAVPLPYSGAYVDLSLFLTDEPASPANAGGAGDARSDGAFRGHLIFNPDLFSRDTVSRFRNHFIHLLEQMVADPARALSGIDVLTSAERTQQLVAWNETAAAYPSDTCVHDLVTEQAERTPDATAVVCGASQQTYRELNERADRFAGRLRALGVGPGVRVGICVERSPEMMVGLLGILKAGGTYVPLDPEFPPARLAFIAEDAGLSVLVTQERLLPSLPEHRAAVVWVDGDGPAGRAPRPATPAPARPVHPDDLAYVIYTSGSTGRPKGVEVPHRGVVNFLTSMAHAPGLRAEQTLLAVTTISFDISVLELFLPLTVGAKVVIATRTDVVDGHALKAALDEHRIDVLQATPATWRLLLQAGWPGAPLTALCGGDVLPRDLAKELLRHTGALWNMYGPTETTVWSTTYRMTDPEAPVLVGRPIANTRTYVLDDRLRPVPIGVTGQLYIGGDGVARGYRGRPELTGERFVVDPWGAPGQRMYRTGDLARYRADGNLELLGREDNQVKVRGFRIELGEIETVLGRREDVAEAVVTARDFGPGDKRLVGYVVPASAGTVSPATLRDHLRAELPDYMVPAHWVEMASLPLTANQKVDRMALPHPTGAGPGNPDAGPPPRTEAERLIAELWREQLKVEGIGVHSNFFDLGGHSLLAMTVIHRIEEATGQRFKPLDLVMQNLGRLAAQCPVNRPEPVPARDAPRWHQRLARAVRRRLGKA